MHCCCLLTLYLYKLSVLVNLSYQHHLFLIFRCACSQPAYCWEKCIHTDCSRVSQLCIRFLLSPFCVAACRSKKRDSRGQDCMPISNWINVCLLSVIFYVLRKSLCSAAQVLSDTLIRRMGQLRVLLLRQKANEGFLLLVIQKRFSHAAHPLNQIQIFELFWSLLWYADCLVGEYFNHTKVRYCHFSFHF